MEGTTTMMDKIITAMTDVFELTGTVLTQITNQEVLLFIFAAGMIPIGIRVFKRMKGAAHG